MVTVSVSELKARLSEHLRRVKGGERVVVTDRGRAVAVIAPADRVVGLDPELQELVDEGLVKAGRPVPDAFWDLPIGKDPNGAVLEALLSERDEGF